MKNALSKRLRVIWLVAVACMGLLHGAGHAQGIAMAVDRVGDVTVSAGGKAARLNVLDYLPNDAELRLAAGSSATLVYLATFQEWQFTGPGQYRLQTGKPTVLQGQAPQARGVPAPAAQAMAKMEPTQRERMALGAVVMRGMGVLRIVSPSNADVLNTRPTLLWRINEARQAHISVLAEGSANPLAQTVTTATQWTLPDALPPGNYTWRAEIVNSPGTVRSGRFRIIDADDERRSNKGPVPQDFAQRVAYAVMLESQDLPHDALLIWRALAAERPDEESLKQWAQ